MNEILYERLIRYITENQDSFYRLAYSYVKNQEDALDAVQNAVCKALEAYEKIKNPDAIKTWFYRILVNECLSILRKSKRVELTDSMEEIAGAYYEKGYEPGDDLLERLSSLDTELQTIIKLRFFEDMSLNEISQITGQKLSTVKSRLYRGLKQLRVDMKGEAV